MTSERRTYQLDELYDFRSGLSKPRGAFGSGFPFLTFKDVFYNYFVPRTLGDLVESSASERANGDIRRGDVFLTRTSETQHELGMSCVALSDVPNATFNGFTKRLRPKPGVKIVPEYAAYYFRSPVFRERISAISTLSTRASLNETMLGQLQMVLPDEDDQLSIGTILKGIDDKIVLLRDMNRTLEEIARVVFRAWFVDFEPVRAKAAGATSFRGMPQALFDALPSAFENSELGKIPQRWGVEQIGNLTDCVGGGTPSTGNDAYWEGGIHPFCTPRDMSRLSSPILRNTERHLTDEGVAKVSSGALPVGVVLLSSRAPIGYIAITDTPLSVNQGIIAMKPTVLPAEFVRFWLEANMDTIKANAGGTTFAEISKSKFRPILALRPPNAALAEFEAFAHPVFQRIAASDTEIETLSALRDTLLPKLMSGELEAPSLEALGLSEVRDG